MSKTAIKLEDKSVIGLASKEQIESWKATYGEIHEITVTDKQGNQRVCYLKEANRDVIAQALSLHSAKKLLECGETILNNCFIGGDELIKTDERLNMAAALQAKETVEFLEATLKKI